MPGQNAKVERQEIKELLASNSSTQSNRSAVINSYTASGLYIRVKLSSTTGVPTYTPKLQYVGNNGDNIDLWIANSGLSSDTSADYMIYPSIASSTTPNSEVNETVRLAVPAQVKFVLTATTADGSNNSTTFADFSWLE